MRLVDLDPQFIRYAPKALVHVATLAEAQGIRFDDPLGMGSLSVVWFRDRGVPDDADPGPLRSTVAAGTGYGDLTLTPSIDQSCGGKYPGEWHGFITGGEVT